MLLLSSSRLWWQRGWRQQRWASITLHPELPTARAIDRGLPVAEITDEVFAQSIPLQQPSEKYQEYTADPQKDLPSCEKQGCLPTDGAKRSVLLTTRDCSGSETEWRRFHAYPLAVDAIYCDKCQQFFFPSRAPKEVLRSKIEYGLEAMKSGHLPEAEFWMRRAANQFPTAVRPHAFLGLLYSDQFSAEPEDSAPFQRLRGYAEYHLTKALQLFESLDADAQQLQFSLIDNVYKHLSALLIGQGRVEAALQVMQRYLEFPALSDADRERAQQFINLNQARLCTNNARNLVGALLFTAENPSGACPDLSPAQLVERLREAIKLAELAIKLDPQLIEAFHLLAKCYQRLGDFDKTHRYFELIARHPTATPAMALRLEYLLSCCQKGLWSQAAAYGEQLLPEVAEHPQEAPNILSTVALAFLLNEQLAKAENTARQLLQRYQTLEDVPPNIANVITTIQHVRSAQVTISQVRNWAQGRQQP